MTTTDSVFKEALALKPSEKAQLINKLLSSDTFSERQMQVDGNLKKRVDRVFDGASKSQEQT